MLRPGDKPGNLPMEALVGAKDRLRDIRDFLRHHRHDRRAREFGRPGGEEPSLQALLGRAATVADDTFQIAESLTRTLLPMRDLDDAPLHGFDHYLSSMPPESWRAERAFRRELYAAAKANRAHFGLSSALIRESMAMAALPEIAAAAAIRQPQEPAADRAARLAAVALCALLAAARREKGAADDKTQILLYGPAILSMALITLQPTALRDVELPRLTRLAVEARLERLISAIAAVDAQQQTAMEMRLLLAHML